MGIVLPDTIFMGGSTRRTLISLPEELLKEGQRLARRRRRNFSNYVADLIAADAEREVSAFYIDDGTKANGSDGAFE